MVRKIGWISAFLVATSADAAIIPPPAEVTRRFLLIAVLGNEDVVAKLLPHGPVDGIEHVSDSTFRVWTKRCEVTVTATVSWESPPGERRELRYHITAGDVRCK